MASRLSPLVHEPVELDSRRVFTARQKAEMFRRAKGHCDLCGVKIHGAWIAGHIIPHALGGRTELSNARVECSDCAKGTHTEDTSTAAKCKRMARHKEEGRGTKRKGPQLKSRPFSTKYRRKVNGTTELRERAKGN